MANDEKSYGDTPERVRVRHRFLGIQPSDVDELEPGGDETDEDRGVMKRQGRKDGGHAKGEHSKSRADRPHRGRGGKTPNFHPGGEKGKLHRELGIPEGEKIGAKRVAAATHSKNPEIRRDAIRARTMSHWHKG